MEGAKLMVSEVWQAVWEHGLRVFLYPYLPRRLEVCVSLEDRPSQLTCPGSGSGRWKQHRPSFWLPTARLPSWGSIGAGFVPP